jgi:hypothetical protein
MQFKELNDLLLATELAFLSWDGLPDRPWYRHQLYAPGSYTGYWDCKKNCVNLFDDIIHKGLTRDSTCRKMLTRG